MDDASQKVERPRALRIHPGYIAGAVAMAILMLALNLPNLKGQSITVDEYAHLPAGYSYLHRRDFKIYPKNPPLIKMIEAAPLTALRPGFSLKNFFEAKGAWGPWEFADGFVDKNRDEAINMWSAARMMNMFLGASLALLVFYWAGKLYGPRSGLLAMFLTAVSPNILAHAGIATVDVGYSLFFVLTWFLLWRLFERFRTVTLILVGVSFGAAQLSKFSGLLMIPILIIVLVALVVRNQVHAEGRQPVSVGRFLLNMTLVGAIVLVMGLVVINAGYFGKRRVEPLHEKNRLSKLINKVEESALGAALRTLPTDYIIGLDAQIADVERGEFGNYINGKWRKKGVWYYFLEALALKTPIPALILIFLGFVFGIWRAAMRGRELRPPRPTLGRGQPAWPFVHLPALLFLALTSLFGNLQLGIRYILPVLPLFFIAASRSVGKHSADVRGSEGVERITTKGLGAAAIVLCLWQAVELGIVAPHYLSYFNEFAGGSKGGHRYLIDSNIDWGQDLPGLKREMDKLGIKEIGLLYFGHADPSLYGIKYHLANKNDDFVAISVNFLRGYPYVFTYVEPWSVKSGGPPGLAENSPPLKLARSLLEVEPAERIGGSIYLYDLRGKSD